MTKMRIFWGDSLTTSEGNAYGYSTHYNSLRKTLDKLGIETTFASDIAVHIATAYVFKPIPGKFNVLYSMYECTTLPPDWISIINQADAMLVPCNQNRDLFRQYFKKPIYVVQEGCNTELYKYHERQFPEERTPFIFLWIGAPNLRKGFAHFGQAWEMWMHKHPELKNKTAVYIKTTGIKGGEGYQHQPQWNMIVDSKNKTVEDLRDMYNEAHAFVLPSMGEGWGLTLIEAAATGLPCIYTPWSGPVMFMRREYAYPVEWRFNYVKTMKKGNILDHESTAAHPEIKSIFHRMEQIYFGYEEALRRGRKMSEIIHRDFTWEKSALRFCDVIREIAEKNNLDIGEEKQAVAV